VPARSISQLSNVVTPFLRLPLQLLRVAPDVPVPERIDSETVLDEPVAALPPASTAVTTGCVGKAVPPVAPLGCVVKTRPTAEPAVMLNAELSPLSVPSLARSL